MVRSHEYILHIDMNILLEVIVAKVSKLGLGLPHCFENSFTLILTSLHYCNIQDTYFMVTLATVIILLYYFVNDSCIMCYTTQT